VVPTSGTMSAGRPCKKGLRFMESIANDPGKITFFNEILKIHGVKEGQPHGLPPYSVICETPGALVEVCKKTGVFLSADTNRASGDLAFNLGNRTQSQFHLFNLSMAFPSRSDNNRVIVPVDSRIWVGHDLLCQLNEQIKDDRSDVRRVSSWPIDRSFVYIDISDFSKVKAFNEVLIINSLISLATRDEYWGGGYTRLAKSDMEASLCIGDGYIFVFRQIECAAFFAGHLANLVEFHIAHEKVAVEFHFRVGVHIGPVYCFWDFGRGAGGNWNYIGDGINGGQRVLAAIGKDKDDSVFFSGEARMALRINADLPGPVPTILKNLQNRGRVADKHGKFWRVYELNHEAIGSYVQPFSGLTYP
jgi:hypothetical protein